MALFLGGLSKPSGISLDREGNVYFTEVPTPGVNGPNSGSNMVNWRQRYPHLVSTPGRLLWISPSLGTGSWNPATVTSDGTHIHPISSAPRMYFRLQN